MALNTALSHCDLVWFKLEDAEYATSTAIKARKVVEQELEEIQMQLDAVSKAKNDVDARCIILTRENNNLTGRIEVSLNQTNM